MKMQTRDFDLTLAGSALLLMLASTTVPASAIPECQAPLSDPDPVIIYEAQDFDEEDELVSSNFGAEIQTSGDILVISANRFDINYVYERNADNEFVLTTAMAGEHFALDGNQLLCVTIDPYTHNEAQIYVRESFGNWNLEFDAIEDLPLYRPLPSGGLLAFSGDRFATATSSSVDIYARLDDGTWDFEGYISNNMVGAAEFSSIAVDQDTVLVGDSSNHDQVNYGGAIFSFKRGEPIDVNFFNMYEWDLAQTLRPTVSMEYGFFGRTVKATDGLMVTSNGLSDEHPINARNVITYRYDGTSWNQDSQFSYETVGLPAEDAKWFGAQTNTDGERLIVSACFAHDTKGTAYVLSPEPGGWNVDRTLIGSDCQEGDLLGRTVTIHGNTAMACTKPTYIIDNEIVVEGRGYVFDLTQSSCEGDMNDDALVNVSDLLLIIGAWGTIEPALDIDGDDLVGVNELLTVLSNWGACN